MIKPEVLDAMVASGCTAEQIAAAVKADMGVRSSNAERQARFRARKKSEGVISNVTSVTERNAASPLDKEIPQTPKEINPPRSAPKGASLTPRAELETVLDAKRAQAIVSHRKRINKALTPYAAQLLARKFAKAADPNAAADAMIANGWQGFEPEWLESRINQRANSPPSKPKTVGEAARLELIRRGEYQNAASQITGPENESERNSGFAGTDIARRIAIAAGG